MQTYEKCSCENRNFMNDQWTQRNFPSTVVSPFKKCFGSAKVLSWLTSINRRPFDALTAYTYPFTYQFSVDISFYVSQPQFHCITVRILLAEQDRPLFPNPTHCHQRASGTVLQSIFQIQTHTLHVTPNQYSPPWLTVFETMERAGETNEVITEGASFWERKLKMFWQEI